MDWLVLAPQMPLSLAGEMPGGPGAWAAPGAPPRRSSAMVHPPGRARLPRLGRSARAGARREGERDPIYRAGLGPHGPGGWWGERGCRPWRGPGEAGGRAPPLSPPCRRDHVGPGARSSRGDVPRGQVLRGGRHRPTGTVCAPRPARTLSRRVPRTSAGARPGAGHRAARQAWPRGRALAGCEGA